MSMFLTTEQPTAAEQQPRQHVRRREVPYYHRHTVRRSTWVDWVTAAALFAAAVWCVSTFGGWPA